MPTSSTSSPLQRIQDLLPDIERDVVVDRIPFTATFAWSEDEVPFGEHRSLDYHPIHEGDRWLKPGARVWFHLSGTVPGKWAGRTVAAKLDVGGEGLVLDSRGHPLQGITDRSVFDTSFFRDTVRLYVDCDGGEKVELWIEAGASGFFGETFEPNPPPGTTPARNSRLGIAHSLQLVCIDRDADGLLQDFRVLLGLARGLPPESAQRARLLSALNDAADIYAGERSHILQARERLAPELKRPADSAAATAIAIGHAHLDTAWLWTYAETRRKVHRTFVTQMRLLAEYPEYVFGASQPQQYAWLIDRDPALFEQIKEAVRDGRWEMLGATWVETDCNLPSGESLVRQLLHGKNFMRDVFGVDVRVLWLPDCFGFPASLPQIMLRAGVDTFLTQKLSWNQVNRFPYSSFRWSGIDGSTVLAHFPPEENYCSTFDSDGMIKAENSYKEKNILGEFIVPFGAGDGGGGPREDYLERALRLQNLEGSPRVQFGRVDAFFERLNQHAQELPLWGGELYLEAHRGTLTSQARIKQYNRRLEFLLAEVENLWSLLPLASYPRDKLDNMWKRLLLNQFHDVLPGSSIGAVYEDVLDDYRKLQDEAESLIGQAAKYYMQPDEQAFTFFNPNPFEFTGLVPLPDDIHGLSTELEAREPVTIEDTAEGTVAEIAIPAHSFVTVRKTGPRETATGRSPAPANPLILENEFARFEFDKKGRLLNGEDYRHRGAFLADGSCANTLTLYDDLPHEWDAWEIDPSYREAIIERLAAHRWERTHTGRLRNTLRFHYAFGNSTFVQSVTLDSTRPLLVFDTEVEWHEDHRMLRAAFPTNVQTDRAACDIQFGFLYRSTVPSTTWEQAKFEVAAHKYVDLSDGQRGVALINDGRYGHSIHGNTLDLNLLRSPRYPDPSCDRGSHHFRYAIYTHAGSVEDSDLVAVATVFNNPPRLFAGLRLNQASTPVWLESSGIALETMKAAEKEDCRILRMVEYRGKKSVGRLRTDRPARIAFTNLMEWETGEIQEVGDGFDLELKPFEIRTCKLWMDDNDA